MPETEPPDADDEDRELWKDVDRLQLTVDELCGYLESYLEDQQLVGEFTLWFYKATGRGLPPD